MIVQSRCSIILSQQERICFGENSAAQSKSSRTASIRRMQVICSRIIWSSSFVWIAVWIIAFNLLHLQNIGLELRPAQSAAADQLPADIQEAARLFWGQSGPVRLQELPQPIARHTVGDFFSVTVVAVFIQEFDDRCTAYPKSSPLRRRRDRRGLEANAAWLGWNALLSLETT